MNTEKTTQERYITLENDKCHFQIDLVKKNIYGSDFTDRNNDPRCYNRKVRSFKKGVEALKTAFNESMTMYQGMKILEELKLDMHSYCARD